LYRGIELADVDPISRHVSVNAGEIVEINFMVLLGEANSPSSFKASLYISPEVPCPDALAGIVDECLCALKAKVEPMLTSGGTGGTYILRNAEQRPLAVFKPKDEEAGGPQNPRGYIGSENSRVYVGPGVPSAHRAVREVAAYLVDRGFAGVPMTTLAHSRHPSFRALDGSGDVVCKVGALQEFVETTETSDNFGCQAYSSQDVHRIGILDIRIANFDRNTGNMLVKVGKSSEGPRTLKLVPIDHGCSLPDRMKIHESNLVWMDWPQAKQPFGEEELDYIKSLDGAEDAQLLSESLGLERDGLRLLEVLTKWLQEAAACGFTLHDIGLALCRPDDSPNTPSPMEEAITSAICTACAAAKHKGGPIPIGMKRTMTVADEPLHHMPVSRSCTDGNAGMFELSALDQNSWSPLLEETFRRHVHAALERLAAARKHLRLSAVDTSSENTCADDGATGRDSLASDSVLEVLPVRSARAYIPPHVRRQLAAEHEAAGIDSNKIAR
jgi:hypothetical protein